MRKSIFLFGLCIIFLDQITKLYVRNTIAVGLSIPIINNIFHITHISNTGVGFGLLKDLGPLIITVTILIIFGMLYYLNKIPDTNLMVICFSLLLGGSIGNLIDRLRFGYVTDFLDFRIWPVFNIADSAVTVGGIILLFWLYKET